MLSFNMLLTLNFHFEKAKDAYCNNLINSVFTRCDIVYRNSKYADIENDKTHISNSYDTKSKKNIPFKQLGV